MNTTIKNACQIMYTHGFEGLYHRLVEQFIHDMPMSDKFINHSPKPPLICQHAMHNQTPNPKPNKAITYQHLYV